MAQNPLLGKRISLISKKSIRYEGVLYSINEENSTVALQNVRSFGTEGRSEQPVAASEAVHPYMVFRGQDIQDLHVHEDVNPPPPPTTAQPVSEPTTNPSPASEIATNPPIPAPEKKPNKTSNSSLQPNHNTESSNKGGNQPPPKSNRRRRNDNNGPRRNDNTTSRRNEVGTGASLLNVRPRGAVDRDDQPQTADFDLAAQTDAFQKEEIIPEVTAYQKDDFFDSLSCDTTDRLAGTDNRLRGHTERKLNTETFGAVALDAHRIGRGRGRGRGGRGRGRGGRGRRGGGRGGRQTAARN